MVKILLVEDDISLHRIIERILKKSIDNLENVLDKTFNSTEALQIYQPNKYDLIITDKDMPRIDEGIEFIRKLKENYNHTFLLPPILMVTGSANQDVYDTITNLGAVGLYTKPIRDSKQFREICLELIYQKKSPTLDTYLTEQIKQRWQ